VLSEEIWGKNFLNPNRRADMSTIEELAEDAFIKQERVDNLMMMNTPVGFEDRKKAFIALAKARAEASEAKQKLDSVT
jgi:hypothetical protein